MQIDPIYSADHIHRPLSLLSFAASGLLFSFLAVLGDTFFYHPSTTFSEAVHSPVITPLNNFRYNSNASNLASHGLHPRYQHFLANLPQLLGPAFILMVLSCVSRTRKALRIPSWTRNTRAVSALSATALLSIFPHQEPRFLLPCVPLLLSCLPVNRLYTCRPLVVSWVAFNAFMGVLMGIYHQGGVIPTQLSIPGIVADHSPANQPDTASVFWWKTYSPPRWLLGDQPIPKISTKDLMGVPGEALLHELDMTLPSCPPSNNNHAVFLVAPKSATFLDKYVTPAFTTMENDPAMHLREVYSYANHLNLDDLDFGDDGVFPTLTRVIGRRGLGVWVVERACSS